MELPRASVQVYARCSAVSKPRMKQPAMECWSNEMNLLSHSVTPILHHSRWLSILAAALAAFPFEAQGRTEIHKGDVVVVPLKGEVAPSLFMFLRRATKAAEAAGASAIVFELDTY